MYIHIWVKYSRNIWENVPINTPKKAKTGGQAGAGVWDGIHRNSRTCKGHARR